jgi:short-subunit dehydrogenase
MKATLITGASSGIGEAFARRLAADGHNLVLVARTEKDLHELCDELMLKHGNIAHYIVADLSRPESAAYVFGETEKHSFEIEWLINNAGFGSMGDFAKLDRDKELQMIDLNIRALVELTHRYLTGMRERGFGKVINVSSAAGFQPVPYMATYAATKAFVTSFSEAIAEENREFAIQVLALCPGSTRTNFFAASDIDKPFELKGQQTAEDVVKTAMRAIAGGRTKIVSGFINKAVAAAAKLAPSSFSRRVAARMLRSRFK